jgi:CheY-like chemotaxis protein
MAARDRKTILVAEDNEDDVFFLRRAFQNADLPYEIIFVPNGREAIDYLSGRQPYDNRERFPLPKALILDLKMPIQGGFDVLEWTRSQPELKDLPVMIHSSSELDVDRSRAKELGANAYYVKSAETRQIVAMFRELIREWIDRVRPD